MAELSSRLDDQVLAEALRDVEGPGVEETLREGMPSVSRLVRKLMGSRSSARRLLDAVTARAIEHRSEDDVPLEFGPVVTDGGTYEDPAVMLDPVGSPEFEAAIDLLVQFEEQIEEPEVHRLGERAGLG